MGFLLSAGKRLLLILLLSNAHSNPRIIRIIKTFSRELVDGKDENIVDALRVRTILYFHVVRVHTKFVFTSADFAVSGVERACYSRSFELRLCQRASYVLK